MARIKTRILILSDTHAHTPLPTPSSTDLSLTSDFVTAVTGYRLPLPAADVVLHCGDLTTRSTPPELRRTLTMLRALHAPLKIIIPGNHDRLLDAAFWHDDDKGYKDPAYHSEALELLQEAEADGVVYLGSNEGAHTFPLANGAVLRLYASPWTPEYGVWGFQYRPEDGHAFGIPAGMDVAMTHGPPRDVLDLAGFLLPQYNVQPTRAGCPDLFAAVARARPRVHCFGHIHESWGAYLARWKTEEVAEVQGDLTAEQAIEAARSRSIVALADIKPMTFLHPPATPAQAARLMDWSAQMGVKIDWEEETKAEDEEDDRVRGEHTLFVNAAIEGYRQEPSQLPFIVDMLLDEAAGLE